MTNLNEFLDSVRRAAENDIELNRKSLDNQCANGQQVIASLAALRAANVSEGELARLLEAAAANPT